MAMTKFSWQNTGLDETVENFSGLVIRTASAESKGSRHGEFIDFIFIIRQLSQYCRIKASVELFEEMTGAKRN